VYDVTEVNPKMDALACVGTTVVSISAPGRSGDDHGRLKPAVRPLAKK
jgi:hypothetical protein